MMLNYHTPRRTGLLPMTLIGAAIAIVFSVALLAGSELYLHAAMVRVGEPLTPNSIPQAHVGARP